jgi:hypothetical protein
MRTFNIIRNGLIGEEVRRESREKEVFVLIGCGDF